MTAHILHRHWSKLASVFVLSMFVAISQQSVLATMGQAASSANMLTPSSFSVEEYATMSADLGVKKNGLFEGIVTVNETLNVHDLFVNGIADVVGNVTFHNSAMLKRHVNFSSDSAGSITVKKGNQKGEVIFVQEYMTSPILTKSIALDHIDDTDIASSSATAIFGQDYKVLVVKKNTKDYMILPNKPVSDDLHNSWTAIGVDGDHQSSVAKAIDGKGGDEK